MTSVGATGANQVAPAPAPAGSAAGTNTAALSGLPEPTATAGSPGDVLGEMLAMMEKMSQLSSSATEQQLSAKHDKLEQARQEFLKKVADAIRKQQKAKHHHHHGLFGSIAHAIGDAVGEVLGTAIDFIKDTVEAPVKMGVGIAKGQNFSSVMQSEMHDLLTNGDWADTIKNCSDGVIGFAGDLQDAVDGIAKDVASGHSLADACERAAKKAWGSFKDNILENPDFWKVTGALATAVAVAAAVMTGGALAFIAVGIIVACEVDNHTHFIKKAFGPKAAPWIKLGMEVAASVMVGGATLASNGSHALEALQAATAIANGVSMVGQGVKTIEDAKQQAGELRAQADVKQALNRMQQIQRMIDDLISVLEEKSDNKKAIEKMGSKLVQTQGAVQAAAIMRA